MIKGCIFDLDGTLIDTISDLANSTNIVLEEAGYPTHSIEAYKHFVGNGIFKLVERATPDDCDRVYELYNRFKEVYREHYLDRSLPYEGIVDLLDELENMEVKLSVVTNKPHEYAVGLCKKRFKTNFVSIYGENVSLYPKKPDPTSVKMALKDMHLNSDEILYIGDSNVDIQTAKASNALGVGVLWGFRSKEELEKEGANYIVSSPKEILDIVKFLNREGK